MSAPGLDLIRCPGCAAPVALVDRPEVACAHCGAAVAIPAAHAEALRARRTGEEARRAAEPLWRRLSAPPARALGLGLALVVVLPVVATCLGSLLPFPPLAQVEVLALFTLPGLLPGAVIALWAEAAEATALQLGEAMSAEPGQGAAAPACRNCGAPLAVEPDAIAATCGYCGSDNLVAAIAGTAGKLHQRMRAALRTLDDAVRALRTRRFMIGLGMAAVAVLVGGAAVLLWRAASGR